MKSRNPADESNSDASDIRRRCQLRKVSKSVSVSPQGCREKIYILINIARTPKVALPWKAREHLSDTDCSGELALSAYGVAILTRRSKWTL
jgi:hypothetical protein